MMANPPQHAESTDVDALAQDTLRIMLLLGKMGETLSLPTEASTINTLFAQLLDHVASHFALEESLMERKAYAGRHWHRLVHRELLNEMRLALARSDDRLPAVDRLMLRRMRAVFVLESDDEDIFRARAKLGLFREVMPDLHPADLAAALPEFDSQQRNALFGDLDTTLASGTLEEVDAPLQRELVASLSIERVAELIDFMTPGQAATVLRNLTPAESWAILKQLGPIRSRKIAALVEHHQSDGLADLATLRYLRAQPDLTCGQLLAGYRSLAAQATVWRYVYVIASDGILLGVADLRDVLLADGACLLADVMMTNVIVLSLTDDTATASRLFRHYGFDALPLVDDRFTLMGVVAARDIL